jgi:cephalosporin-C deacetylase-like acetyl esterase
MAHFIVTRSSAGKDLGLAWLKEKIYANRMPVELNPRHNKMSHFDELHVLSSIWWSQKNLFSHAFTFRRQEDDQVLPLTIAVWDKGTKSLRSHLEWIRETCLSSRAVMVLDVSGVGTLRPHSTNHGEPEDYYGILHKLNDDLIWMNDSMTAMRIYDVIRAIEMASQMSNINAEDINLYGEGRQGMYAQLAAALDNRVKKLDLVNGMQSVTEWVKARHYNNYDISGVVLPGMLRHFDLPDLQVQS